MNFDTKPDIIQHFLVTAGAHSYYCNITTRYHITTKEPISYFIDVGGAMKGCVRILVEKPNESHQHDERYSIFEAGKHIASIPWIGYNKQYSVKKDLPSGDGTRHMIRTSLTIVLNTFPWISKFDLTDASKVICKEGHEVSLANLSFVTNGKSYYEKYLGAYLQNTEERVKYVEASKMLYDRNKKISLADFISRFRVYDNIVHKTYESSATYSEFFNNLKDSCRQNGQVFCNIMSGWLEDFVMFIFKTNRLGNVWMSTWIIDKESVKKIPIKEWKELYNVKEVQNIMQEEFKDYFAQHGGYTNGSFVMGDLSD